ncbi:MAG TPA: DUF4262 domain-containing protein [Acidimicrobiales bacterium]
MADVFPDRSMEHRDKVAWMIETNGWHLEAVPARPDLDPPIPGYAYTVGLEDAFAFPEVVVFGLTPAASRGLVGLVVELLQAGAEIPVGELFRGLLDNDLRSALLPVDVEEYEDLFGAATAWYGSSDYRVAQLAWPDRNGWMPWEAGFDHRLLLAQPVVGTVAVD